MEMELVKSLELSLTLGHRALTLRKKEIQEGWIWMYVEFI